MREISLTKGAVALVDDEDYEALSRHRWHLGSHGYAMRTTCAGGRSTILMHRAITEAASGLIVDHRNGAKLDNRRANLRVVTQTENQANRKRLNSNNTSGARGVTFTAWGWRAQIHSHGRLIFLGCYASKEDAIRARRAAEPAYFGEACAA